MFILGVIGARLADASILGAILIAACVLAIALAGAIFGQRRS
jgi:hypothetical protein